MLKAKLWTIAGMSIFVFSCAKKVSAPVAETTTKVELPAEIAAGKTLYENSCARCHKLFPATKHDKEGWIKTLDKMAPKAKIDDEQKTLVYNYLTYGM